MKSYHLFKSKQNLTLFMFLFFNKRNKKKEVNKGKGIGTWSCRGGSGTNCNDGRKDDRIERRDLIEKEKVANALSLLWFFLKVPSSFSLYIFYITILLNMEITISPVLYLLCVFFSSYRDYGCLMSSLQRKELQNFEVTNVFCCLFIFIPEILRWLFFYYKVQTIGLKVRLSLAPCTILLYFINNTLGLSFFLFNNK